MKKLCVEAAEVFMAVRFSVSLRSRIRPMQTVLLALCSLHPVSLGKMLKPKLPLRLCHSCVNVCEWLKLLVKAASTISV